MYRVGILGAAGIAPQAMIEPARRRGDTVVQAVASRRPGAAAEYAKRHRIPAAYEGYEALLADPDVDIVYNALPPSEHARWSIAALEAGKHVLCEKPMALTAADCERMISACRANGVQLGIAYYRRFYPLLARIRELLASGEIGSPVIAQVNAFERFNPGPEHPRRWLLQPQRSGGGPMADFGCHRIEVLLDLLGPVRQAEGRSGRIVFHDRAAEDTSIARLEFESGAWATLAVTHAAMESQDTLDIFGSAESLRVGSLNSGGLLIRTAAGERIENHPPHANLHQPLVEDFCRALLGGGTPAVDGVRGREVTAILDRIYSRGG
jgi:predicted dehydrogenase